MHAEAEFLATFHVALLGHAGDRALVFGITYERDFDLGIRGGQKRGMPARAFGGILAGVVNDRAMRAGLGADRVNVPNEPGHVLGPVLVASGHRPGKRVDDNQYTGKLCRFLRFPDQVDDLVPIGLRVEKVDRAWDRRERDVEIGRYLVLQLQSFDALDDTDATFGREVDD